METKTLLVGITSFIAGGLLVSIAATTFEKDKEPTTNNTSMQSSMQMSADSLKSKTGDDFDKTFISEMIAHHQGAIEMAKLAPNNAKHEEIKRLSSDIITAQEKEINEMKQWQKGWGYQISENTQMHHSGM